MRSKISFLTLLVSSFILVIAFQNCASQSDGPSANIPFRPNSPGGGDVNCLAMAVPYIKLGFIFNSSLPASVDIEVNDEILYSDCGRAVGGGAIIREGSKIEFYKGYESLEEVTPQPIHVKLYKNNSCDIGNRTEIVSATEPQYEQYSLCGTNSVRLDVDYLVN